MPLTPSFGDKLIGPILKLYSAAELQVFRLLAGTLFGGRVASGMTWLARMMLKLPTLRASLTQLATNLNTKSQKQIEATLREAWRTGRNAANADAPSRVKPSERDLEKLIDDVNHVVEQANRNIPVVGENIYRRIVQEAQREENSTNQQRIVQRALAKFARLGITGFVDKRGRRYDLVSYVETAVRTAITHAEVEAYTQQLAAAGHDLVIVSDVQGSCPLCLDFEGHILSISGLTVGAISRDTRTGRAVKVDVLCSLEQARERGLFHRGCRHTLGIWTPDDPLPPASIRRTETQRAASRRRAIQRRQGRANDRIAAAAHK